MFNIFKRKNYSIEEIEEVSFSSMYQDKVEAMARDYAKTIDKLIYDFFNHKGITDFKVGFKRLSRVNHIHDRHTDYYYKNKLVITIYPWEITRKGVDTKATLNYKLHYLEQEKDKC